MKTPVRLTKAFVVHTTPVLAKLIDEHARRRRQTTPSAWARAALAAALEHDGITLPEGAFEAPPYKTRSTASRMSHA